MKTHLSTLALSVFAMGIISCGDDTVEDTIDFNPTANTSYMFYLDGIIADTLHSKTDSTATSWRYVNGTESLAGAFYINDITGDGKFNGYFSWVSSNRQFDEVLVTKTGVSTWDTSRVYDQSSSVGLNDSIQPFYATYKNKSLTLRNDTLKLILNNSVLAFDIDDATETSMKASADYFARSTEIQGHPDSTNFSYDRRAWKLRELRITK